MYTVGREIHFSYGHRLLHYEGKCARMHGHNGRAVIELSAAGLDRQGMVVDFFKIRATIGEWIQKTLDHRMILSAEDPLAAMLKERGEEIVVMNENPTAEAIAKWIYQEARRMDLPVTKVTLWETENSFAAYHE